MADNQYVNKVKYGDDTLMDLTQDTVTPSDVATGATFHDASGAQRTGTLPVDTFQTKTGDTKDNVTTFSQAGTRANIASGEKLSVLFGKIMKFFADLKTVAFSGSYNDLSNKPVDATQSASGLMSSTDKTKLDGIAEGATANAGTVTGIKMNGASKGTSGVVDLGTVLTAHQDISGKLNTTGDASNTTAAFSTAATRANISTGEKLSVIFGKIAKYFSDLGTWAFKSSGTSSDVGLGNVTNNKQVKGLASGTTENHVVTFGSDGYTVKDSGYTIGKSVPSDAKFTDTTYSAVTQSTNGLMTASDKKRMDSEGKFVTCSTARNVAAKVANCTGFVLQTGSHIFVKFTDTGTSNPASGNLTLNINNTGAKNILFCQAAATTWQATYSHANYFYNNQVYEFVYDGTQWLTFLGRDFYTWKQNTKDQEGYVTKGSGNANKVWKTDANGNPAWRDDNTASISITNNLLATTPGTALDATQGKILKDAQDEITSGLYPYFSDFELLSNDDVASKTFTAQKNGFFYVSFESNGAIAGDVSFTIKINNVLAYKFLFGIAGNPSKWFQITSPIYRIKENEVISVANNLRGIKIYFAE